MSKKTHTKDHTLYESVNIMSKKGKFRETESRSVIAQATGSRSRTFLQTDTREFVTKLNTYG